MICRQNHSKTAETSKHGLCEVVCYCSVTKSCPTVCDPRDCSTPDFPVFRSFWSLLKIMSIESVMPSNHFILCRPLLLLPSIFPSIRVFSNESALRVRETFYPSSKLPHSSGEDAPGGCQSWMWEVSAPHSPVCSRARNPGGDVAG